MYSICRVNERTIHVQIKRKEIIMDIEQLQELKARLDNVKTSLAVKEAKSKELRTELKEKYNLEPDDITARKKIITNELKTSETKINELTENIKELLAEYEAD